MVSQHKWHLGNEIPKLGWASSITSPPQIHTVAEFSEIVNNDKQKCLNDVKFKFAKAVFNTKFFWNVKAIVFKNSPTSISNPMSKFRKIAKVKS